MEIEVEPALGWLASSISFRKSVVFFLHVKSARVRQPRDTYGVDAATPLV